MIARPAPLCSKGQLTRHDYDLLNRRTLTTYHDTSTIAYAYDGANRLTQINDSTDTGDPITCEHDTLDRLTSESSTRERISYGYDIAGRRTSRTLGVGNTSASYGYDANDRLTQITQGTQSVTVGYDTADRRTSLTLPNGIRIEYGYDQASRLTGLTYKLGSATLGTLTYGYDKNGQRTQVGGSLARTNLPAPVSSATYDAANQILTFDGFPVTHDANGNLTSLDGDTFTWNVRDQLVGIVGSGLSASFGYDGFGRRITKALNGQSTTFAHDGVNVVEEFSGGSLSASLLTGLTVDEVFSRTEAGTTRFFLPDVLGSTVALTDSASQVQTEYTYAPFGRTTVTGAASTNTFQFTGRENDGLTGLYYYRARYYHPVLQRFISEDPIGFAGGDVNLYGYVGNRPIDLIDPRGTDTIGAGIQTGVSLLANQIQATTQLVIDDSGNVGFAATLCYGGVTEAAGFYLGGVGSVGTTPTIEGLSGPSVDVGSIVSAPIPLVPSPAAGGSVTSSSSGTTFNVCGGINLGVSPVDTSGMSCRTVVVPLF
ncbi:MAG: RHS repeat-associated core domain-containing protein [Candidatus Binatia bacterium]